MRESEHRYTIVVSAEGGRRYPCIRRSTLFPGMSPFWIWTQIAIVVFVLIGMVVAITKLA